LKIPLSLPAATITNCGGVLGKFHSMLWDGWKLVDGTQPQITKGKDVESFTSAATVDEWTPINKRARAALVQGVSAEHLPIIISDTIAHGAWQALKDQYDRDTANTTISLLKTVIDTRLINGSSTSEHLTAFTHR
jgi:hypothetical protein